MNCWVVPSGMEGFAGLTVMDVSTAAVTVKLSVPVTEPELAEMVIVPWATACAKPVELIVAKALLDELQATELLRF